MDKVIIHYFDRNFRRIARRSVNPTLKGYVKTPIALISLVTRVKEAPLEAAASIASAVGVKKPVPVIKAASNSGKENTPAGSRTTKEADEDLKQKREKVNHVKMTPPTALKTGVLARQNQVPQTPKMPGASKETNSESLIPTVLKKLSKPRPTDVVGDNVKKDYAQSHVLNSDDKMHPYWDIHYSFVDANGNVLEAESLSKLVLNA